MEAKGGGGMSERKYYLIDKESPVMGVIQKAIAIQNQFIEWMGTLKEEYGASNCLTYGGGRFAGLVFNGEAPAGWRKKEDMWVPDKKLKAGREIAQRIAVGPKGMDPWRFGGMMGTELKADCTPYSHGTIYFTLYEKHGDRFILSVPEIAQVDPPGCTLLKMSEYWRIVEEAKEQAA